MSQTSLTDCSLYLHRLRLRGELTQSCSVDCSDSEHVLLSCHQPVADEPAMNMRKCHMKTHYPFYLLWTDPELNLKLTNQEAVKQKQTWIKMSFKYQIIASNSCLLFLLLSSSSDASLQVLQQQIKCQEDYEMI